MPGMLQHVSIINIRVPVKGRRLQSVQQLICPLALLDALPRSTTVFSHSQTVVLCGSCSTVLCTPTGGRARLTEGELRGGSKNGGS